MICIPCRKAADMNLPEEHLKCTGPGSCLCQHRKKKENNANPSDPIAATVSPELGRESIPVP